MFSIALKGMSQEVINSKGTRIVIDSSKWSFSGTHIYNKNSGNVGIGISSPTAQLHTTGGVRFAGIGTNVANTKVLTTDADGNVTTRLFSNLLSGNAVTSINGLTNSVQTFATGTSGSSFNIVSNGQTHTFNLPAASANSSGTLSSADWNSFNGRLNAVQATTAAAATTSSNTTTINNTGAYWNANQLQGNNVSSTAPASGQVLNWNGTAWTPSTTTHTLSSSTNTITSVVNGVSVTAPAVNSVSNTSSANTLTTTVNGVTGSSVNMINSISNTSSANTMRTTVNGVAGATVNIINTNTLTQNGTNQLVSTVNGVGSTALTVSATGDVTGNLGATVVGKINGSPLGTTTGATSGQVLSWNGTAWVPASAAPSTTTHTLSNPVNTITSVVNGVSVTAPSVNTVSNTSSANTLTTTVNGVAGSSVNLINSNTLTQNGTNQLVSTVNGIASSALTANTTGDVTGNLGATVVAKINGSPLGTTTGASNGQVLTWNGSAWVPAAVPAGSVTHTLSSAANTLTSDVNGVSGNASIINSISNTSAANTLTTTVNGVTGSSVNLVNSNTLTQNGTNQLLSTVNGVAADALTITSTGDVTGNLGATVVEKINGSPLGTTTGATSGQTLTWNGAAWAPATPVDEIAAGRLGSNFTTTSTSAANTNLKFAIGANESYYVVVEGSISKSSNSSGSKLAVSVPSGATVSGETYGGAGSLTNAQVMNILSANTLTSNAISTATGVQVPFRMTFTVTSSTTTGNVIIQAASVSSGTTTIYAGTRMTWTKVTSL